MSGLELGFIVLWFICSLAVWLIYHRLFTVYYLNLTNGCIKEFVVSGFIGVWIALLILKFWYVSIILIILVLIALFKKNS